MAPNPRYHINLDAKYDSLQLIDIPRLVQECDVEWFNQTLCKVNDSVARLGIIHGEFHWHKHDDEDEFFLVLEGRLLIDLEDKTVELAPHQGFAIPRGVRHRTRAPGRTIILMVEKSGINPEGD